MSDLTRRPKSRLSRRAREERAYKLVMTGGAAALVAVVTAVLAIVGVLGWGLPIAAAVVAAVCGVLFRRTVGL
jgi:putative flippase GtrA